MQFTQSKQKFYEVCYHTINFLNEMEICYKQKKYQNNDLKQIRNSLKTILKQERIDKLEMSKRFLLKIYP